MVCGFQEEKKICPVYDKNWFKLNEINVLQTSNTPIQENKRNVLAYGSSLTAFQHHLFL